MAWGYGTASDVTVRDLATVGVGGTAIRVRISNVFGDEPLAIGAASASFNPSGGSPRTASIVRSMFTVVNLSETTAPWRT